MKKGTGEKGGVSKYMTLYMSLGICFGVSGGLVLYPENMVMGMCFGLPIGMCIGMLIGSAKDKRLAEKMMTITRIETTKGSTITIYTLDKNGTEKEYTVTEEKMKAEKFSVNDRVAEETDGSLLSLESK